VTRDISQYEAAYSADYGFEAVMVSYRRRFLLERLHKQRPRAVLEIGCGSELLYGDFFAGGGKVDQWTIVEPGKHFAEAARLHARNFPQVTVIEGFFEEAAPSLIRSGEPPPFIICSSLLHEVPDAGKLLEAIAAVMGGDTVVHINVPNAGSFHRRLARSMGLLRDLAEKSDRNVQLQQQRVFDRESLRSEVTRAGLDVLEDGGYLVKPFTHAQMELIREQLGAAVLDGLFQLGKEAPEWASEIFVEARKAAA
jgi:SAM-dependent methyltransferase